MNSEHTFKLSQNAGRGLCVFFPLDFLLRSAQSMCMKLVISLHNVTLTEAIENHILSRIDKLEHFDRFAVNARVTLEHDSTKAQGRQFKCSMLLVVPGPDLFAEDVEGDLYAAIDLVTKKIEQQIRKRQNKYKARKHTDGARTKRIRQEAEL
jgi:putative sigma-54 modulation protein